MSVINTANIRMLLSIVTMTVAIRTSGEVFAALEASKASYTAMTKGKKGHGKGPPDTYNFLAVLLVIKEKITDETQTQLVDAFISGHGPDSKRARSLTRARGRGRERGRGRGRPKRAPLTRTEPLREKREPTLCDRPPQCRRKENRPLFKFCCYFVSKSHKRV